MISVFRINERRKEELMRIRNIFRNSFFSMLSQFTLLVVGFFSQRAMNLHMGRELVGMNGVISNVIAMLSVTELGVCTAIVYHLYGAVARNDQQEIASLMNLYRKAYHVFAAVIMTLGVLILPFIHLFMKNHVYSVSYIRVLYMLWLLRTVLSYLLSYKKSLLIADQKEYVVSIVTLCMNVLNYSTIILIVTYTEKYLPALVLNILIDAVLNICLSMYVDRRYPYLKELRKARIEKSVMQTVVRDLKNIFVSRVSQKILTCTDNLIISGFISVGVVGLYSNYCLITQNVSNILIILSETIQPSIGNLFIEKDYEKDYRVLRQLTFVFFLLISVATAGLYSLIDPFVIDFWLGHSYELQWATVLLCIAVCVIQGIGLPLMIVMGVTGLFPQERNLSILTAVVNLTVSILLVKPLGVSGVLIGTCLSYLIQLLYRFFVFFRVYIHRECRRYGGDILEYIVLIILETLGVHWLIQQVYMEGNVWTFILSMLICCIVPMALNLLIYCASWRMRSVLGLFRLLRGQDETV